MLKKKLLSIAMTAAVGASMLSCMPVSADGPAAQNGVAEAVVTDGDITTVTQTRSAPEGDRHYYIGEITESETARLLSVTVSISANSGGSNVTGGAKQEFTDETYGIIAPADYDALFAKTEFMPWVSDTDAARNADITDYVKEKADNGTCYLYVWVQNAGTEITVTATYSSAEYDADIALAVSGKRASASYDVSYNAPNRELSAYMAVYDADGSVKDVEFTKLTTGTETLSYTAEDDGEYAVKAFLWDGMQPVCAAKEGYIGDASGFADTAAITLAEDSLFDESEDTGLAYVKEVDVDRLLAPSFEMHGLSAPNNAERYGGWERKGASNWGSSNDGFTLAGHSLGHWMSAASEFYNTLGDEELLEKLNYVVGKLDELQNAELGEDAQVVSKEYIGGCPEETFTKCFNGDPDWANGYWVPWYGVHKIYQGLIDVYNVTGSETAFGVLKKFADWAADGTSGLTDSQMQSVLNTEYGGMNEVFAVMYELTGEPKYLETARRFTHDSILDPLIAGIDSLGGLHANTQIPKVIGAAELYNIDGETYGDYRTACENFWDFVVNDRSYAIGGNSVSEHFENNKDSETLGVKTCESCNTYNMMRLTEKLFAWEHNSEYMDWYEDALYNHILGQQEPETGAKMYFVSLLQGHHRVYEVKDESWWCCTGTGMENPARYERCVYYEDHDELYVNLYMPNTYTWEDKGLTFVTETNYPYSENIKITVSSGSGRAALHLRAPGWLAEEMTARVGDESYSAQGGGYLTVDRVWNEGDVIELTIPMSVRTYYSREDNQIAYKYGPVALAAPLGSCEGVSGVEEYISNETRIDTVTADVPYLVIDPDEAPETLVETVNESELTFKIAGENNSGGEDITLVPFYEIHHQFYTVYWNTEADESQLLEKALNDITIDKVEPDGQQDELGHGLETNTSGEVHQGSFSGTDGKSHMYRDAWGAVDEDSGELPYFAYTLEVSEGQNYLYAAYWGSDVPFTRDGTTYNREFEILIDGEKIAEQTINKNKPDSVYGVFYEIPSELTEGKESVRVTLRAKTAASCACMLELRTTTGTLELQ